MPATRTRREAFQCGTRGNVDAVVHDELQVAFHARRARKMFVASVEPIECL